MKSSLFYTDDLLYVHIWHGAYWRHLFFFSFFYTRFLFISLSWFFHNFLNYFWIVKLFRIYYNLNFFNYENFRIEDEIVFTDVNPNLDFSLFFCIELIFLRYPPFFRRLNTKYTHINYKYFSLIFEIPSHVDFYPYDKKIKRFIKGVIVKKTMRIRRVHYYDKLTRSLKSGLVK